jgi:hypothetical protein
MLGGGHGPCLPPWLRQCAHLRLDVRLSLHSSILFFRGILFQECHVMQPIKMPSTTTRDPAGKSFLQ